MRSKLHKSPTGILGVNIAPDGEAKTHPARDPFAGWIIGSSKICAAQFDSATRRLRVKISPRTAKAR